MKILCSMSRTDPCRKLGAALIAILTLMTAGLAPAANAAGSAEFEVRDEVIVPGLQPFATSISGIGNGSRFIANGGFEPVIFRTMFRVSEPAENRIITDPRILTNFNSWHEGVLEGAEVEVFRIENGAFRSSGSTGSARAAPMPRAGST